MLSVHSRSVWHMKEQIISLVFSSWTKHWDKLVSLTQSIAFLQQSSSDWKWHDAFEHSLTFTGLKLDGRQTRGLMPRVRCHAVVAELMSSSAVWVMHVDAACMFARHLELLRWLKEALQHFTRLTKENICIIICKCIKINFYDNCPHLEIRTYTRVSNRSMRLSVWLIWLKIALKWLEYKVLYLDPHTWTCTRLLWL